MVYAQFSIILLIYALRYLSIIFVINKNVFTVLKKNYCNYKNYKDRRLLRLKLRTLNEIIRRNICC